MLALVDGQYVDEVALSIHDLGFLRGYGVFDYLRTYKGRPFHLQEHLQRLAYSAKEIGLQLPYSFSQITYWIENLLHKMSGAESSIKIILTAGDSPDHFFPQGPCRFIILVYPLVTPKSALYTQGVHAITLNTARPLPKVKSLYYVPGVYALAQNRQATEALYLGEKKEILEGTTSNFFSFTKAGLHTADEDNVIFGITRAVVLRLANDLFPVLHAPVFYQNISLIEEAFITSSSREILPVISIDGIPIGKGIVGERTKQLMRSFTEYTEGFVWPEIFVERHIS